jgi:hypothetical protein
MTDAQPSTILTQSPQGATISTAYVGRQMRAFAIAEHEVRTISMMNTLATIFFSIGTTCLGVAIGIWTNAMFYEKLTPEGTILSHVAAPGLCVFWLIFVVLGFWALRSRSATWEAIRRESLSGS